MPLHQVPAQVIAVERLPLTDSGKINRPALSGTPAAAYAALVPPLRQVTYTPRTRLVHASYTPLTRLLHASYTPRTPLSHASRTPLARLLYAALVPSLRQDRSLRGQGSGSAGAGGGLVGLEVTVAHVWRRALGFDSGYRDDAGEAALGAGAHWFDLGGDSVLAIRYSVYSVYSLYSTQATRFKVLSLLVIRYSVYFTRSSL
jgi:hypothetical protein